MSRANTDIDLAAGGSVGVVPDSRSHGWVAVVCGCTLSCSVVAVPNGGVGRRRPNQSKGCGLSGRPMPT
eukprot:3082513-Rhodomonas_salina.1